MAAASVVPELRRRTSIAVSQGTGTGLALHKFQVEVEVKKRLQSSGTDTASTIAVAYDLLQAVINSSVRPQTLDTS